MDTIQIADWIFSILLMASFLTASIRKERFNDSLQFNLIQVFVSIGFTVIGFTMGSWGYALRSIFFLIVAGLNLFRKYEKKKKKKENGRA